MQKQYINPTLRIHYTNTINIIITSDPNLGFGDGETDKQDAASRDSDWSSFDK